MLAHKPFFVDNFFAPLQGTTFQLIFGILLRGTSNALTHAPEGILN